MAVIDKIVNFTDRHRVLSHLLFWMCMFLVLLSRYGPYDDEEYSLINEIFNASFYLSFSIAGAYFISYRIIPGLMKGHQYTRVTLELIAGSYVLAVVARILVVHVLEPIVRTPPFEQESLTEIVTSLSPLFSYLGHAYSTAVIFILIKLQKDQYVVKKHALELEKQKAESELNSLKAQLNPHFLFNTLNNIYSLSLMNSPQTSRSIARLSAILDHLLYRCSSNFVPLSQEITLLHHYIELEKLRYDERLEISFSHTTDHDVLIAPLILLSLVENAFKHGAGEEAGHPSIHIRMHLSGNLFHFKVTNSFIPTPREQPTSGIGLVNIRKQLELLYPGRHRFHAGATENTYTTTLELELPRDEPHHT